MMPNAVLSQAATAGGYLLVLAIALPALGILLAVALGGRQVERVAGVFLPAGLVVAAAILAATWRSGEPLLYVVGGWMPPLGIALRADGLSVVMMAISALVVCAVGLFARADFRTPTASAEARAPFAFWILLLAIYGALNIVFVAGDLFTLYVALELVSFAAVPLVCLDGRPETLQAALRYLLFALVGSVLYLVGVVLLYGTYGTLDLVLLSQQVRAERATFVAAALMTVGLLAKTALFPLHLWLPPAHAAAPAAGSAVLSALVVKASFFIIVRLWFGVMPGVPGFTAAQLLAGLGAGAIVFGSILALRQERLKLLIAYSTLAQIGYLFLMFPLAFDAGTARLESGGALTGGMLQAMSHATAKAAMFMSAGLIYAALGHDRITGLAGIGRALPLTIVVFALSGVALIGVPPSGAYLAKELLLQAAVGTGQWWWGVVIQTGGILTSSYVLLVLYHALMSPDAPVTLRAPRVPRMQEAAALALAVCSLLLALVPWERYLPVPRGTPAAHFDLGALLKMLWPILAGGVLAILLGRWADRPAALRFGNSVVAIVEPARRATLALGGLIERLDSVLRQWTAAGLSLLALVVIFTAAMLAAR
jgi:multicomponent Na+:H+ antiporter subunit D